MVTSASRGPKICQMSAELKPPAVKPPVRRRDWLAVLALLLAVASGGAYFWEHSRGVTGSELLQFTSLYVACPLALSVILLFAWLQYPK